MHSVRTPLIGSELTFVVAGFISIQRLSNFHKTDILDYVNLLSIYLSHVLLVTYHTFVVVSLLCSERSAMSVSSLTQLCCYVTWTFKLSINVSNMVWNAGILSDWLIPTLIDSTINQMNYMMS